MKTLCELFRSMSASLRFLILMIVVSSFLCPSIGYATEDDAGDNPWEKFGVNLGVFLFRTDSEFRIGSGVGVDIDVEDILGLDEDDMVFRTDVSWRFSENRRHRLDFTWFSLNRDGSRKIEDDITVGVGDDEITIEAGNTVDSFFNLDIYELAYSYSFFQDDRIDLAALVGLYVMPIDFGINVSGLVNVNESEKFTAPLPVVGLRMDIALAPRWFLRTGTQIFYLEYDKFKGSIVDVMAAFEYNPWKHVGIGLGFDLLGVRLEAEGEDWPGIDFNGKVEFIYTGFQLYLRFSY